MNAVTIPEQYVGYRARKIRRALIRYGRVRAMTLTGWNETSPDGWNIAFRDTFPGAGHLNEDDLALSLAWGTRHEQPGPDWPTGDLLRSYEHIASFASPEPDDVQVARELNERSDLLAAVADSVQQILREWVEASPAARRRWQINHDRFDLLTEAARQQT